MVTAQCGCSTSPGYSTATVPRFSLVAVSCDRLLLALTLYLWCNVVVTVPRVSTAACVLWTFSITVVLFTLHYRPVFSSLSYYLWYLQNISDRSQKPASNKRPKRGRCQSCVQHCENCSAEHQQLLYLYGFFVFYQFLSFFVTITVQTFIGGTRAVRVANSFTSTAAFFNSLLNPLLYC